MTRRKKKSASREVTEQESMELLED